MGLVHQHTSMRAVWTFLRRTRERLAHFSREIPGANLRVDPVIATIAGAEAEMLAADPDLPLRRISAPKLDNGPRDIDRVQALSKRVEELEASVRVREEQLAMMAHDLRGPLSPVMLMVNNLQLQAKCGDLSPEQIEVRLEAIDHRLRAFVRQLDHLLESTRLQTGEISLDPEPLDLAETTRRIAAEAVCGMVKPPAIRYEGPDALTGAWDRARIDQVVRNLVTNAVRYGAHQPVDVLLADATDGVTLIVRDRGIGIPRADQDRIFHKHVRLGTCRGFGLGLWIVKQVVDAMGGTIAVKSAPGAGSEFKVVLPRPS